MGWWVWVPGLLQSSSITLRNLSANFLLQYHVPPRLTQAQSFMKRSDEGMPVSLSLPFPAPSLIAFTWNSHLSTCPLLSIPESSLLGQTTITSYWSACFCPHPLLTKESLLKTSHVNCFHLDTILRPPVTVEWNPRSPPWLGTHLSCLCLCLFPLTLLLFLRDMAFRENTYAPGPLHSCSQALSPSLNRFRVSDAQGSLLWRLFILWTCSSVLPFYM